MTAPPSPGTPGAPDGSTARLSMAQVLLCGALILTLSMGIRHGFGLWLQPVTMERGWSREAFALAIAIQNLGWGVAAPLAGVFADRFGAFRVLLVAACCMPPAWRAWPRPPPAWALR